jgi:hypothetical protein
MRLEIFLSLAYDLAFTAVSELEGRVLERKPEGAADFDAHFRGDVVDAAGLVAEQIETDDFEDPFAVPPGANVNVADVGKLGDEAGGDAGFFAHLADGGFIRLFALVDKSLGKGENEPGRALAAGAGGGRVRTVLFRFDGRDVPVAGHAPENHAARRELAYHAQTR